MKITPHLKALAPGGSKTFPLSQYESILATNTRLKRKGFGTFTASQDGKIVTVTRIS